MSGSRRTTTKVEPLVLCALCLLIPTASVVAEDSEDPELEVTPESDEAVQGQESSLKLDLAFPRSDPPRASHVRATHITTQGDEESRSGLSLEFGPVLLGALQDKPPEIPAASDDPKTAAHGHANLAEAATNPVAPLIQLQFQNVSNFKNAAGSGYANTFLIQPVIPFKIGEQNFISRTTFPLLATTADLGAPLGHVYGTGDLVALNFATWGVHNPTWGGFTGVGLALTFPTASSDFLGEGKFQAGPGFIYINTATPRIQWGILAYQQWSYASSGGDGRRPQVSKLFWEPILNYHFDHGWYASFQGDQLWTVDWEAGTWALPIAARVGRVFKMGTTNVNLFFQPFYDATWPDSGGAQWGFKINFTLLFPE